MAKRPKTLARISFAANRPETLPGRVREFEFNPAIGEHQYRGKDHTAEELAGFIDHLLLTWDHDYVGYRPKIRLIEPEYPNLKRARAVKAARLAQDEGHRHPQPSPPPALGGRPDASAAGGSR